MALYCSRANDFGRVRLRCLRMTLLPFATGETAYLGTNRYYVYPSLFPVFGGRAYSSPPPCILRRGKEEDAIIPKISASVTNRREISIFVSHDHALCSQRAARLWEGKGHRAGNIILGPDWVPRSHPKLSAKILKMKA